MKRMWGALIFVGAASFLLVVLIRTYDRLPRDVFHVRWGYAAAAIAAIAIASTAIAVVWIDVLRGLGVSIALPSSVRILALSQLGKYLPGGFWQPVGWLELGRRAGIRPGTGSVSILMVMTFVLAGALIVGPVWLAIDGSAGPFIWLVLVVPIVIAAVHPRVLRRLLTLAARVVRREVNAPTLSFLRVVRGLAATIPIWLIYGLALILAAESLNLPAADQGALLTGAFAVAWAVGYLAIPVPGGLAVREAVLMLLLRAGGIDAAPSAALAVASRLYFIVAEGSMALAVLLIRKPSSAADVGSPERVSE